MSIDWANLKSGEFTELFNQFNEHDYVMALDMVEMNNVDWSNLEMHYLTCVNHPWSRYVTKNPWERSIHFIQGPNGMSSMIDSDECDCPFTDLRVVLEKEKV